MAWYSHDWLYRFAVTVDHTKVGASRTQDFPITEDTADIPAGFWSHVKSDGTDIVVTSDDGETKLKRYLVDLDTGSETIELHVEAALDTGTDTVVYVYYGNTEGAETNDADTFDSELHLPLEEDPGSSNPTDVTGNHSPAKHGTWASGDLLDGKLGKAWDFDRTDSDYLSIADAADLDLPSAFTVGFWVFFDDLSQQIYLISKSSFGDNKRSWHVMWQGSATNEWGASTSTDGSSTTTFYKFAHAISTGTWYFVLAVYDSSLSAGNRWKFYVDASSKTPTVSSDGSGAPYNNNVPVTAGARMEQGTPDKFHEGRLDAVRIWRRALASGEVTTRHNAESSPATFAAAGAEEALGLIEFDLAASESEGLGFEIVEPVVFVLAGSEAVGLDFTAAQGTDLDFSLAAAQTEGLPFAVIEPVVFILAECEAEGLEFDVYNKLVVDFGLAASQSEALTFQPHQIAETSGRVSIRAVGATYEIRHVDLHHRRKGVPYTFQLEAVWVGDNDDALLWASEDWLTVSVDGDGAQAVGTTRETAAELGAGEAGDRKTLDLTLTIPADEEIRSRVIRLTVGLGT